MTIAVGVLCHGGVAVASDSQEVVQGYWKRKVWKLSIQDIGEDGPMSLIVAGAGRAGYIDALSQKLGEVFSDARGNWQQAVDGFRRELQVFHRDHVVPYPDLPEVSALIAMQKGDAMAYLYATDRSTMSEEEESTAVGIGSGHARAILARMDIPRHKLSVDAAVALAVFVVHHTSAHVADCGDETVVAGIHKGETFLVPPESVKGMEEIFSRYMETLEPWIAAGIIGARRPPTPTFYRYLVKARKAVMRLASKRVRGSGIEEIVGSEPS
jgi:20S proteasome alpha/beta subunit